MRALISERLRTPRPAVPMAAAARGDHDLNPGTPPVPAALLRPAAVLVPLVERPQGMQVLLTQRTAGLRNHAGQIAFPGGRLEDCDCDVIDCALRETEEEIGLPRRHVDVIGSLDTYVTGTGFSVTPVVGFVTPGFDLRPDPGEVAEVFEVPLEYLLDPANLRRHSGTLHGVERHWYAIPYRNYYIWGATAGMLVNLSQKVRGP